MLKQWFKDLSSKLKGHVEKFKYKMNIKHAISDFKKYADEMVENVEKNSDNIDCRTVVEFLWLHNQIIHLYNSDTNDFDLLIELQEIFNHYTLDKSNPQSLAGYGFKTVLEIVLEEYGIQL